MKIDYYGVVLLDGRLQPDMEHELSREDAATRATTGRPVVAKVFLRVEGGAQLAALEERLQAALAPLGFK